MKKSCEYLVVGGGIMGLAIAYNLAKKGAKDVVLVEQQYLGYGSTGRCGTGIRQQYARPERAIMGRECIKLWENLSEELGSDCGFVQGGYCYALYDEDWIPRYEGYAKMHNELGIPTRIISPDELSEIVPLFNTEGVRAATYCHTDGKANPFATVCSYAIASKRLGVDIYQYTEVSGIEEKDDGGWRVTTNKGNIEARELIIAGGSWSCLLGDMIGIEIPVQPFVEEALVTEPLAEGIIKPLLNVKTPKFDDFWLTQTTVNNGVIMGWGHMQWMSGEVSYDMTTSQKYAHKALWNLVRAFPSFANVNIVRHFSGFYDVVPDREPIVSKVPGKNLHVALAATFMHAPICGQAIAEMLTDGACTCIPIDFCRIERFTDGTKIEAMPY